MESSRRGEADLESWITCIIDAMGAVPRPPEAKPNVDLQRTLKDFTDTLDRTPELREELARVLTPETQEAHAVMPPFQTRSIFPALTLGAPMLVAAGVNLDALIQDREVERRRVVRLTFFFFLMVGAVITYKIVDEFNLLTIAPSIALAWFAAAKAGELFDKRYPA